MFFIQRSPFGSSIDPGELSFSNLVRVEQIAVTGSAVTSVNFTGLNSDTDGIYLLIYKWIRAAGGASDLSCYANADTTATNYYFQYLSASHNVVSAARGNVSVMGGSLTTKDSLGYAWISAVDGQFQVISQGVYDQAATVIMRHYMMSKTSLLSTPAYIDELTFTGGVASSIEVGSTFDLYKLGNW